MPVEMSARVALVDDSELARALVSRLLADAPGVVFLGAFESVAALEASPFVSNVDVVLLDVFLPERSGLSSIRALASSARVLVLSEASDDSEIAREALAQGASGFVAKASLGTERGRAHLLERLRAYAVDASPVGLGRLPVLIVVGSTGAPRALEQLIPELVDAHAATVIAQHAPPGGEREIARWVTTLGLTAKPARTGDLLEPRRTLVIPGGMHARLLVSGMLGLSPASAPHEVAPSADVLLRSAAWLGRRLVAVVLSGLGCDGASGVASLAGTGAVCLVQHPLDCVADSMPRAALATSSAVHAVRLSQLGAHARARIERVR